MLPEGMGSRRRGVHAPDRREEEVGARAAQCSAFVMQRSATSTSTALGMLARPRFSMLIPR